MMMCLRYFLSGMTHRTTFGNVCVASTQHIYRQSSNIARAKSTQSVTDAQEGPAQVSTDCDPHSKNVPAPCRQATAEDEVPDAGDGASADVAKLHDLLKQKFYFHSAFSIYGGVTGVYDWGPLGCAVKNNVLAAWRRHFVHADHMMEVDSPILTPEALLQASGHVARFSDCLVRCLSTGQCFRADHLLTAHLEGLLADGRTPAPLRAEVTSLLPLVDGMAREELRRTMREYDVRSPTGGGELTDPMEFNLMFSTSIGPTGSVKGYLRPETAQGIFVNFKELLAQNQGQLPLAVAQVGTVFRNEIAPRGGLLRAREFIMAEIEHFCDPLDKSHRKFASVADTQLTLLPAREQHEGRAAVVMTAGHALAKGVIGSELVGYYLARTQQFLARVGVDPARLRFRQHRPTEMAHYASDCWDAETLISYGWLECVGVADRACYDLRAHAAATHSKFVVERTLAQPTETAGDSQMLPSQKFRKVFNANKVLMNRVGAEMTKVGNAELQNMLDNEGSVTLRVDGRTYKLTPDMIKVTEGKKIVCSEEFTPSVIEPSFGIGRIVYSMLEHNFRQREGDEQRSYLALPAVMAPYMCAVLPLTTNAHVEPLVEQVSRLLHDEDVSHRIDPTDRGSIGRRYARTDQMAIPYAITVDYDSLHDGAATLRERDSMTQIRARFVELPRVVRDLAAGRTTWPAVRDEYMAQDVGTS